MSANIYVSYAINDFENMALTLSLPFILNLYFFLVSKPVFQLDREIGEIFLYSCITTRACLAFEKIADIEILIQTYFLPRIYPVC